MVSISWCYLQKWKRLLSSNDQMFTLLSFSYSNNDYYLPVEETMEVMEYFVIR